MISRHASPRLSTPQVQGPEPGPRVWGGLSPAAHTRLPIPAGVATDAKVGSELIQVLALDADIGNNSLVFYSILAIHYFQALANDSEDVGQVFTMGRGSSHFMACRSDEIGSVGVPQGIGGQSATSVLLFTHPTIHLSISISTHPLSSLLPTSSSIHPCIRSFIFIHSSAHPSPHSPFHISSYLSICAPHSPLHQALY